MPASRIPDLLVQQTESMKKSGWDPKQIQARFVSEIRRAREAGVLLVFGTDCGAELMVRGQQYKALYGETQMGSTPMELIIEEACAALRTNLQTGYGPIASWLNNRESKGKS